MRASTSTSARAPSLESTNFIFDRGGKALYKLAAKPSRVQGVADEHDHLLLQPRLEGRDRYRLILVGDRKHPWLRGTSIGAEIRINEGSGFRRESLILADRGRSSMTSTTFELDFEAPGRPDDYRPPCDRAGVPYGAHGAALYAASLLCGPPRDPEARPIEREEMPLADLQPEPAVAANGSYR